MKKIICLSFDIEDWFQVENLRMVFPPESWDKQELRVEKNTHVILDLLDTFRIKATFFILGWVAKKLPFLVKEISSRGHEVASHGFSHLLNYNLCHENLLDDILTSKVILEDLVGKSVVGYRAPSFSITDEVLRVLSEAGFKYDSSFNNFPQHDRYGKISGFNGTKPFRHKSGVTEFPMPILPIVGFNIPISGGGYFRIFPLRFFNRLVRLYLLQNNVYVFYMHPWEVDPSQPKIKKIKKSFYFRHYYGLGSSLQKLERFIKINLSTGSFLPLRDCMKVMEGRF